MDQGIIKILWCFNLYHCQILDHFCRFCSQYLAAKHSLTILHKIFSDLWTFFKFLLLEFKILMN